MEDVTDDPRAAPLADDSVVLSVIIPVHDRDEPLRRALDSVVGQARTDALSCARHRVEVIIVDDGSQAPFAAVADSLAQSAPRAPTNMDVGVIHRRRSGGPSAARNTGIGAARGTWLMVLDSDDVLGQGALSAVLDELADNRACAEAPPETGVICFDVRTVGIDGTNVARPELQPGFPDAALSVLSGSFVVAADIAMTVGYDEQLRFGENTDFILRCADECRRRGQAIRSIDLVLSVYNKPSGQRPYDLARYESTVHLLARGRFDLAIPAVRAKQYAIAAVNAARLGRYRQSVKHAALAVRAEPGNPRNLIRVALACTGPIAKRRWLRA